MSTVSFKKGITMSQKLTAGQAFCNVALFFIAALPLAVTGIAIFIMAEGIERWSAGGFCLAMAFGISQGIWRNLSGK